MEGIYVEGIRLLVAFLGTIVASTGFWVWLQKRADKNSANTKLLMGLAHDRIIELSEVYLARGSITKDEYDSLVIYLYKPYAEAGGNGLIERIMKDVSALPLITNERNTDD